MDGFKGNRISFLGRMGRSQFASQFVGAFLAMLVSSVVLLLNYPAQATLPVFGILVIGMVFLVSRATSRLRDMDYSGWLLLIPLIYFLVALYFTVGQNWLAMFHSGAIAQGERLGFTKGIGNLLVSMIPLNLFFVWLFLWPGTRGINRYGDDPRGRVETFMTQEDDFFQEFFSFSGRASRYLLIRGLAGVILIYFVCQTQITIFLYHFGIGLTQEQLMAITFLLNQSTFSGIILMIIGGITLILLFASLLSIFTRRFHDFNFSGWWSLSVIAVIGVKYMGHIWPLSVLQTSSWWGYTLWIYLLFLIFHKGTQGVNQYGEENSDLSREDEVEEIEIEEKDRLTLSDAEREKIEIGTLASKYEKWRAERAWQYENEEMKKEEEEKIKKDRFI